MAKKTHGLSRSKPYRAYIRMLHRCYNKDDKDFRNYGGRPEGPITVCDRWRGEDGFLRFLEDLGEPPSSDHSIERTDNSQGYQVGNVVWADRRTQSRNRRNCRYLTLGEKTMTLTDWCELYQQDVKRVWRRLQRGWELHEALTRKAA